MLRGRLTKAQKQAAEPLEALADIRVKDQLRLSRGLVARLWGRGGASDHLGRRSKASLYRLLQLEARHTAEAGLGRHVEQASGHALQRALRELSGLQAARG